MFFLIERKEAYMNILIVVGVIIGAVVLAAGVVLYCFSQALDGIHNLRNEDLGLPFPEDSDTPLR
jgi:hypothetical protein